MAIRRSIQRNEPQTRNEEIQDVWEQYSTLYKVIGGIFLVLVGIYIGGIIFAEDAGYATNLYTEAISIGVTVFVLDALNRWRDKQRREEELKTMLIRNIGSPDNATALNAARELADKGWLQDGCLRSANLSNANLKGATLFQAQLQGATIASANLESASIEESALEGAAFVNANLHHANLREANLRQTVMNFADLTRANLEFVLLDGAMLTSANMQQAQLNESSITNANLAEADLGNAQLQRTDLTGSDLGGAILKGANLTRARLENVNFRNPLGNFAVFDENTILPDGSNFQHDNGAEQLERFTNPDHPEFWSPDAYDV